MSIFKKLASNIFKKLTSEIKEEDRARWKQGRIDHRESLTCDYQLGYFVGAEIYNRHLPTLSTDMLQSPRVIKVSDDEEKEHKMLEDAWFKSTQSKSLLAPLKWELCRANDLMLEQKYLPNPLLCHLCLLKITKMEEFKEGLIDYLWDCDLCSYSLKPENIDIFDDDILYFTVIKFKLPCKEN